MKCQVRRNSKGNITRVDDSNGKESKLFVTIAKHPIIKDSDSALKIFKNIYTNGIEENSRFIHRVSNGTTYESYKDALLNTKEGGQIEVGFMSIEKGFNPIVSVTKNTNKKTENGFINHSIETGILSPQRTLGQDGYVYQGEGDDTITQIVNTEILIQDANAFLGTEGVKRLGNNTFTLQKTNDKIKLVKQNGDVEYIDKKELNSLSYQELQQKYPNIAMDVVIAREFSNNTPAYSRVTQTQSDIVTRSEEDLQIALMSLLNKMGVKVTSISNYVRNYKIRNRVNPSARALADISNEVIAFSEGNINLNDLTEETAHFINEAMPQERVENLLRNIHRTEEWKQFSQVYENVYSQEYSGEQLDNAVRREVLGKVVANSIKNNFSKVNKTETQGNIIDNVYEMVSEFFQRVSQFFKSDFKRELEDYKDSIDELLLREDISDLVNTDNFKDNKFRLYNVSPSTSTSGKIYMAAKKAVRALEVQLNSNLGKEKINRLKVEQIDKSLEDNQQLEAVSGIVSLSENYVKILNAAIKESEKNNSSYLFTNEEDIIYQSLIKSLAPSLSELKEIISSNINESNKDTWKKLQSEIDDITLNVQQIKAKASIKDTGAIKRLIDKIVERHNLDDSARDYIEDWIDEAQKDTNYFHSTFGQLIHSRDGLLNLAGSLITDMTNEANWEWMSQQKSFQQNLKELGVKESELAKFVDESGQFMVSEFDQYKFEQKRDEIYAKAYRKATGSTLSDEDIIKQKNDKSLPELESDQEATFRQEERTLLNDEIERRFKPEYYENYEKRLTDNNISEATKKFLANYYSEVSELKRKAISVVEGKEILDYSKLSESDLEKLEQLNSNRKFYKSYINETGNLKSGLEYITEGGQLVLNERGQPQVQLSENTTDEATIAMDLNKLDELSRKEFSKDSDTKDGIPQSFIDMLNKIDTENGREAAVKFMNVNSYIGFSSEFWNGLGGSSLIDKLKKAKDVNPTEVDNIDKLIDDIVKTNTRLRGILKLYSSKNTPSEINAERMSRATRDTVKELQESVTTLYRNASKYTSDIEIEEQDITSRGTSSANKSYITALKEEDAFALDTEQESVQLDKLKKEFEFAKQHMTEENRKSIERSMDIVDAFLRGDRITVPSSIERILDENSLEPNDLNDTSFYVFVMQNLIRGKVLPYYKKFSPEGSELEMEAIENGEGKLGDIIKDLTSKYLEISPNYSFFDKELDNNRNDKFIEDYQGGYLQPKAEKYSSKQFKDLFGTVVNGVSSKNQNLYEAYKLTLDFNKKSLDAMNMGKGFNYFRLPQVRKQDIQRVKSLTTGFSVEGLKGALQDTFNFTEDDQVKGETQFGNGVKVIPKRFVNRLENPNDISDDLFFSLSARAKEAYLRNARMKHYGDFMSIYDKMLTRSYNGKAAEATQTVKMFKSAMDYNLFGVKETATYPVDTPLGTFDIAKIARTLLQLIKFRNLGLNFVIPITSAITGAATTFNESLIGEHINKRSQVLGSKELSKLLGKGSMELGKINTEEKLNVLGQYFRAFDMDESFANSNYGFLLRNAPRTGMFLHQAANYPIYGQILLGILHDYRVTDGKISNFNSFEQAKKRQGLTNDEIKTQWNLLEDNVLYNFLDVEKAEVKVDKKKLSEMLYDEAGKPMSDERLDEYVENVMNGVQSFSSNVIANVDGQIPNEMRVTAQRHFLLNFFMTHRGWLSIATSRRFKNRHLNTNTGTIEEGSYRSAWNYLGRYLKEYKKSNFINILGSFKEAYNKADTTERQNLKRVGIEMAMLSGLMTISFLLANAAEDDDNKDEFALQLTNYLTYRMVNELSSVQFGIGNNYTDIIESPFVGLQTVENLGEALGGGIFDDEEVTRGRYKGYQKNEKLLIQLIPGAKQVFDVQNMNSTYDTYKFYNQRNIKLSPLGLLWAEHDKRKKDKK